MNTVFSFFQTQLWRDRELFTIWVFVVVWVFLIIIIFKVLFFPKQNRKLPNLQKEQK